MHRLVALLVALAFVAVACGGDDGPPGVVDVEITAEGFDPASAETTVGQPIEFTNDDSAPHTIVIPDGQEQLVEAGETFTYTGEGCCAATFTDRETGAEFEIAVADPFDDD
jgi:plastocyanin